MCRLAVIIIGTLVSIALAQDFTGEQYKKALWMATRFYGAQRSGAGPNWLHMDSNYPTSFMRDSIDGKDVTGGWFDAGDHVMFGQTQYYAAYVLAMSYEYFPKGFHDLYTEDYSDYKKAASFGYTNGTPDGIPDIVSELRYEMDFFCKAAPDANTFIFQKGVGSKDHSSWGIPGWVSTRPNDKGGESDKHRDIFKNPNDANMAGYCAAALAVMARLDPDAGRRTQYLTHAEYAYQYAKAHPGTGGTSQSGGEYAAQNFSYKDALTSAATELWQTTKNEQYKTEATAYAKDVVMNANQLMDWANDEPLGAFNAQFILKVMPSAVDQQLVSFVNKAVNSLGDGGVTTKFSSFFTRGPSGYAFLQALMNVATGTNTNDKFIYDQMDFILGSNSAKKSFLIGFTENGATCPQYPQHRGVFGKPDNSTDMTNFNNWNGYVSGYEKLAIPAEHKELGGLVGGANPPSGFQDNMSLYDQSEVTLELNAPLVGALAYVVSKLAPASITPVCKYQYTKQSGMEISYMRNCSVLQITVTFKSPKELQNAAIYSIDGRVITRFKSPLRADHYSFKIDLTGEVKGIYLFKAQAGGTEISQRFVAN